MTEPPVPDREPESTPSEGRYSLRDDEIETMYDEHIMKLKQAVKLLKMRAGSEQMRRMDQDNPIDSPSGYDI
jgi:hypothetical protein